MPKLTTWIEPDALELTVKWPAPGARGTIKFATSGSTDEAADVKVFAAIPIGTVFDLVEYPEEVDRRRCRVRIGHGPRQTVWVLKSCVEPNE